MSITDQVLAALLVYGLPVLFGVIIGPAAIQVARAIH